MNETSETLDPAILAGWIGRTRTATDTLRCWPALALEGLLDREPALADGDPLPLGHHWLYFHEVTRRDGLGPDGHPRRGGFLPPVALPRRMWAGGRLTLERPLTIGAAATRTSRIADIRVKQGRSGTLAFVTVSHRIADEAGGLLVEEHDVVYREGTGTATGPGRATERTGAASTGPMDGMPAWHSTVVPDPVLLFRYSALTYNGHRIHYDRDYARGVECYGGLVVHGPLLIDLIRQRRPDRLLTHFAFLAQATVIDTAPFDLNATSQPDGAITLWVTRADSVTAMREKAS